MIIECEECNTRFRLDDSRIKPNGVKVRCTKCQNVFIVTPPPPPEEVQVEEVFGASPFDSDRAAAPDGSEADASGGAGESFSEGTPDPSGASPADVPGGPSDRETTAGPPDSSDAAPAGPDGPGGVMDDGLSEPPELSFGGPDFSSLASSDEKAQEAEGVQGGAAEGDGAAPPERMDNTERPWFEMPGEGTDDGFPEDGLPDKPAFDGAPLPDDGPFPSFDDEGQDGDRTAEAPVSDAPGIETEAASGEDGEKGPAYGEFDFGFDDEEGTTPDETAEVPADALAGEWGMEEGSGQEGLLDNAADTGIGEEAAADEGEVPAEVKEDFKLTPPPSPPVSSADDKVIPFSPGYSRNGRASGRSAPRQEEEEGIKFEDLFSRTLSEVTGEPSPGPDSAVAAGIDDEEFEEDGHEKAAPVAAAPRASGSGKGILLAVLIFIIGGGAIYFSGIIDTLARTLAPSAQTVSTVEIEKIGGYFTQNKNFGRFFVIEAKLKNTSDQAQPIKTVTGVIYDSRGKSIATRSVSPGRVVAPEDLKNLSKRELLSRFRDSSGGVIPPQGTVPVMVPFTEIPAGMTEYGLNIVRQ
ncbi:MAG: DUF3426 domain-containing protein [Thermodesulfobacteriota bacterium]